MSGLVGYATSDSESEEKDTVPITRPAQAQTQPASKGLPTKEPPSREQTQAAPSPPRIKDPANPPQSITSPNPGPEEQLLSGNQTTLHNLTLPSVPNLDIPPSPPGSPNATTATKVTQFLALKERGVHFNAKLAASTSIRNPALLGRLVEVAGLMDQEVYASSLPVELWDPMTLQIRAREGMVERRKGKGVEFVKGRV